MLFLYLLVGKTLRILQRARGHAPGVELDHACLQETAIIVGLIKSQDAGSGVSKGIRHYRLME